MFSRSGFARYVAGFALVISGCADPLPEFGQVQGVVKAKGKPLKGMIVTFMPDPSQGNDLPINASGETDAQGQYKLHYAYKGREGEGAPVGWHRVTVHDTRYSSIPQGQPLPPRQFSLDYSNPTITPLSFEVKRGPQTIDLEVK